MLLISILIGAAVAQCILLKIAHGFELCQIEGVACCRRNQAHGQAPVHAHEPGGHIGLDP